MLTVLPSIRGSRSRCTPSRETSDEVFSERLATLSISSMKTMPFCSTVWMAFCLISSSLTSLAASSSRTCFMASATFILRVLRLSEDMLENMFCSWLVISSMPGGAMISTPAPLLRRSISISLSSSSPSRSFLRNSWRVEESSVFWLSSLKSRGGGIRASRMRSSAASMARCSWRFISFSRSILMAISARSRIMDSTSRPT